MKIGSLAVALAALAGMLGVTTPARAASVCPDGGQYTATPGERIKGPDSAEIYLVDPEGLRRWIPTQALYLDLFRDWNGVRTRADIACIRRGANLDPAGTGLRKSSDSAKVYMVLGGQKRWIVNSGTFDKYHFAWNHIVTQQPSVINGIPTGTDWI
jgi:hypothetical protein